jgi:outer membrane protein assembly factor BamA
MQRLLLLAIAATWLLAAPDVLSRIAVEGGERFPADAIAGATGLQPGGSVSKEALDEACNRLLGTGLILGCQYRYGGGVVTFEVLETEATQEARIDLPGIQPDKFWAWAKVNAPLVQPKMPPNSDAGKFYVDAIQRFLEEQKLAEPVEPRIEMNLQTQQTVLVFRPANPAKVSGVRVVGSSLIPEERLETILRGVAVGSEYTEYDFRKLLDLNIRPLYEEFGRLNVKFSSVEAKREGSTVVVTAKVDEGQEYKLRQASVSLDGTPVEAAGFPVGRTANWKEVEQAVEARIRELRDKGRLDARSRIARTLDETANAADVNVTIESGPVYTFGRLQVVGLTAATLERVMPLWTMREGDPANGSEASAFIDRVFKQLPQGSGIRGASLQQRVREGQRVVDYTVTFK